MADTALCNWVAPLISSSIRCPSLTMFQPRSPSYWSWNTASTICLEIFALAVPSTSDALPFPWLTLSCHSGLNTSITSSVKPFLHIKWSLPIMPYHSTVFIVFMYRPLPEINFFFTSLPMGASIASLVFNAASSVPITTHGMYMCQVNICWINEWIIKRIKAFRLWKVFIVEHQHSSNNNASKHVWDEPRRSGSLS